MRACIHADKDWSDVQDEVEKLTAVLVAGEIFAKTMDDVHADYRGERCSLQANSFMKECEVKAQVALRATRNKRDLVPTCFFEEDLIDASKPKHAPDVDD